MSSNFQVGNEVIPGYRVMSVKNKPVMSAMTNPVIDLTEVQVDCPYENAAFLAFATFMENVPPADQWIRFGLSGTENIQQRWKSKSIKQECICIDYTKRAENGQLNAVTHLIAARKNILVSTQLMWFGFPMLNWFFVGFKPGMRERAEELMLAALKLA